MTKNVFIEFSLVPNLKKVNFLETRIQLLIIFHYNLKFRTYNKKKHNLKCDRYKNNPKKMENNKRICTHSHILKDVKFCFLGLKFIIFNFNYLKK